MLHTKLQRPNEIGKLEPCRVRNIGRVGSGHHTEKKPNIKDSECLALSLFHDTSIYVLVSERILTRGVFWGELFAHFRVVHHAVRGAVLKGMVSPAVLIVPNFPTSR